MLLGISSSLRHGDPFCPTPSVAYQFTRACNVGIKESRPPPSRLLTGIGDSHPRPRKASLSSESSAIWLLPASVDLRTPLVVLPPSHPVLSHPEPTPCSTADGSFCQPL